MEDTDIATQQGANETVTPENETQQGQQTATEEQPRVLSARETAMAAIQEKLNRELQEQGVIPADEQQDQAATSQSAQTPEVPKTDQPAERMLTVKINGVEKEVPESEVIRNYQIEQAARQRMEEASTLLNEVRGLKEQLSQRQAAPAATPADETKTDQQKPTDDAAELARQIVEGIAEGNFDSATDVLAKVLAEKSDPQTAPAVDEAALTQIVDQRLTEKEFAADFARAKEMFDKDYAEINANPRLSQLCNDIYQEQVQAGKRPSEAAKIAGDEVKALFAPAATTTTSTQSQQIREERKKSIDTIRPAVSVTSVGGESEKPSDPASVIAEMKKARGQT